MVNIQIQYGECRDRCSIFYGGSDGGSSEFSITNVAYIIYRYITFSRSATSDICLMYDSVVSASPTVPSIIRDDITLRRTRGRLNQETIEMQRIRRLQQRGEEIRIM